MLTLRGINNVTWTLNSLKDGAVGVFMEAVDEPVGMTLFEETIDDVAIKSTVVSLEFNREDGRLELLMCTTVEVIGDSVADILTDTKDCVKVTLDVDKLGCDVSMWFALVLSNRTVVTAVDVISFVEVDESNCKIFFDETVDTAEVEYSSWVSLELFGVFMYDWSMVLEGNIPVEGATLDVELVFKVTVTLSELVSWTRFELALELETGPRRRLKLFVLMYNCDDVWDNNAEGVPLKTELSFKVTVRRVVFKSEEWLKLPDTDDIIFVAVMFDTELSLEVAINSWEVAWFEPVT